MRICTQRFARAALLVILAVMVTLGCSKAQAPKPTSGSAEETKVTFSVYQLPLGKPQAVIASGQEFFKDSKYVGSKSCQSCHEKQYDEWQKTWHAKMARPASPDIIVADFNNVTLEYKNLKVEKPDGQPGKPITVSLRLENRDGRYNYTLIDKDNESNNQTYEVIEVLGGNWDQHFDVKVGDQMYPAPMRWSVADKSWLASGFRADEWFVDDGTSDGRPRRPNELKKGRTADAKCRGCHETGYQVSFDKESKKWKGTSLELGIGCERCHGPGSKHVQTEGAAGTIVHGIKDLTALQQDQMCAQCHGRNTNKKEKDLAFQVGFLPGDVDMSKRASFWSYDEMDPERNKYFWPSNWARRNRQQWQDFTKSKHFWKTDMSCLTCHTFHGEQVGRQLRVSPAQICANCHNQKGLAALPNYEVFAGSPMAQVGVTCVDCHMPKIGWRTNPTLANPKTHWDVTSHTFMVSKPQYTTEYGQRSSCDQCHGSDGKATLKLDTAAQDTMLKTRQAEIRGRIEKANTNLAMVRGLLASRPSAEIQAKVDRAAARVDTLIMDGSQGFHNYSKAVSWLDEADALLSEASRALGK